MLQPKKRTTTYGLRSISYTGAKLWNDLLHILNSDVEFDVFKSSLTILSIDHLDPTFTYVEFTLLFLAFSTFACGYFLAATKQLYEWSSPSVRLSVCLSVRPSVCHIFLTMFPSSYHHEISRSYDQRSRSEVKVTQVNTQLNSFRTGTPV